MTVFIVLSSWLGNCKSSLDTLMNADLEPSGRWPRDKANQLQM